VHIHRPTTQFLGSFPSSSPRRYSLQCPGHPFWSADDPPAPANIRGSVETALLRPHPLHSGHVKNHHFFFWHRGHCSTRLSTNHAFSAPSNLCPSASSQLCISIDQRQSALKPSLVVAWAAKGAVLEWATSDARDSRWTALDRCREGAWSHCLVPSGNPLYLAAQSDPPHDNKGP